MEASFRVMAEASEGLGHFIGRCSTHDRQMVAIKELIASSLKDIVNPTKEGESNSSLFSRGSVVVPTWHWLRKPGLVHQ